MGADESAHGAPPFDPDDLVRHARFVKSLARELARDDDEADELAARTLETALARRPASGGSLRIWLKRVVGRLFLRTRRADARRRRREEAVSSREATSATVDDVARLELERMVAAAFAALAEPYRTTLFLRYFDDLKPREIAARMEVPVETVNTRTKRGLARLREQLDAKHGGRREGWHAGAIALAAARVPVAAAVKAKVAVAAVGVVLLAGGGWLATKVAREGRRGDAVRNGAVVSAAEVATAASTLSGDERSRETEPSRAPAADQRLPLLAGVVVDDSGAPVERAAIIPAVINRDDARNYYVEELHVDRAKESAIAWSDANGRFRVDATPRDCVGIHVWKEGFGVGEAYDLAADRTANQEISVVLPKAAAIHGRIRDSEGQPIHFAMIRAHDDEITTRKLVARNLPGRPKYCTGQRWNSIRTTPRVDGSFEIDEIPAGRFHVLINSWGYEFGGCSASEATAPLDVVLRRKGVILDVVDAQTHEPIDDVRTLVGLAAGDGPMADQPTAFQQKVLQGADDVSPRNRVAFSFWPELARRWMKDPNADRGMIRLQLVAPGHHTRAVDVELSRSQEPPHLTVELEPGADEPSLTGQVLCGARAHIEVRFPRRDCRDSALQHEFPIRSVDCDADGRFKIAGLPPASYRLFVSARGFAQRWFDVAVPAHDATFELKPAAALEARVADASGEGVPEVAVFVQTPDEERAWIGLTDASGTAVFDELPDGDVLVAAFRYSRDLRLRPYPLQSEQLPVDSRRTLAAGARSRVELLLPEKRPAVFRLRDARGNPVSDAFVRYAGVHGSADWQEPGFGDRLHKMMLEPMKVESDETFHLDLYPSRYAFAIEVEGIVQRIEIDVTAGGASEFEIRLPIRGPTGALRGRIVEFGSGRPMATVNVVWAKGEDPRKSQAMRSTSTDADGRYAFEGVPVGPIIVVAYGPEKTHGSTSKRIDLLEDGELTVDLPIGRYRPDVSDIASVTTDIAIVDDATGAPIEGADVWIEAEVDGAQVYLGGFDADHEGRVRDQITAAARYIVTATARLPSRPPYVSRWEKAKVVVEPLDATLRATIRLHRKS